MGPPACRHRGATRRNGRKIGRFTKWPPHGFSEREGFALQELEIEIATRTDVGRVRTNNEDALSSDAAAGLFIVCDGMGGHSAGEVASSLTCSVVNRQILRAEAQAELNHFAESGSINDAQKLSKTLADAVTVACEEVFDTSAADPSKQGMGTTCTVLWILPHGKALLAHVGDSRLYLARAGQVYQISDDHTYVNELFKRGIITKEETAHHPQGNILSRALGVTRELAVDTMLFDLDPEDVIFLCSDGVHSYFATPAELGAELSVQSLQDGVDALIDKALARGGHDNATGIAVRIPPSESPGGGAMTVRSRMAMMRNGSMFAHLSYVEMMRLLGCSESRTFAAGDMIARRGDPARLIVLLEGQLEVTSTECESTTLLGPGAFLGQHTMVVDAPCQSDIKASSAATLVVLNRGDIQPLLKTDPVMTTKILWGLVQEHAYTQSAQAPQGGDDLPPSGHTPGRDGQSREKGR